MGTRRRPDQAPYIREVAPDSGRCGALWSRTSPSPRIRARAPGCTRIRSGWAGTLSIIHACVGNPTAGTYAPTRPFQIPLGALIPQRVKNVIAACKNIGTTHLTNGAYRLHPVEWNIGESAGMLAVFCCEESRTPREVWDDIKLVRRLQMRLLRRGMPLAWGVDVPPDHPMWICTQMLLLHGVARSSTLGSAARAAHRCAG